MNQPQIIDTALATAYEKHASLSLKMMNNDKTITFHQERDYSYSAKEIARCQAENAKLDIEYTALQAEILNLNAQYTGWTRAFLVSNGNGHVHRSMNCSTCFATTNFLWLPEWSGKDEAEIIDAAGSSACTVCYPDAPVESLNRASRIEDPAKAEARAERAQKKAEREAKAIATGITNPDGTPLKIRGWVIKTERTAQIEGVDSLVWNIYYPQAHNFRDNADNALKVAEALAFKRGTSVEEQMNLLIAKAQKKAKAAA